jgi:hypothetical protein
MAKKKDTSSKIPRTPAYMRFEHNLSKVKIFIDQSAQRFRDAHKVMKRSGPILQSAVGSDTKTRVRRVLKTAESLKELSDDLVLGFFAFSEWTAVMLMTFVQEYIEESLVTVAEKKMEIMENVAPIEWKRIRDCQSLEELTQSVRREWAQSRMRGRKIREWFNVFEKLGAPKYDPAHCDTLQHLFDTRNLIVHSASKPSPYYLNRYPSQLRDAASGEIRVTNPNKHDWLECLKSLLDSTDEFVLKFGS